MRHFLVVIVVLWIFYTASGFRNPLTPIVHSDDYQSAAIRQALFTSAALCALTIMFFTRNIGSAFPNRSLLLLSIVVPISIIWSTDKLLTVKRILVLFAMTTLYALVYSSRKPVDKLLKITVSSVAVIALVSMLIHFGFGQAYTVNPARPGLAGTSTHPNTLAPIVSIALILSLGMVAQSFYGFVALRGAQAIMGLALILTQSITTIMTTMIAIGIYSLLACNSYKRGLQHILILSLFIAGSLIGWGTLKSTAFKVAGRDESLSGRDEVWKIIMAEGFKRPIFGNGYAFWTEGKGDNW